MADDDTPTQVDDTHTADPTPDTPPKDDEHAAMAAALKKANAEARKFRLELEQVRTATLSENERAIELARAEGRSEGAKAAASRLVDAEVRAAVAGRSVDVKALLEGLDRSRFLDDEGEPDTDRITKWVNRIVPAPAEPDPRAPRVPTGPRSPTNSSSGDPSEVFADFINGQLRR